MSERLSGRVSVVTGTGGSMGRATALAFAREGASVVGCDVTVEHVDHIPRTTRGKFRMLVQNIDLRRYLGAAEESVS